MSPYVITFGRKDGSAHKSIFEDSKGQALRFANVLSLVLFGHFGFKSSECHEDKRVEDENFYVQFTIRRTRSQFGKVQK